MSDLPSLTGPELLKLLLGDGWEIKRQGLHGVFLFKKIGDEILTTTISVKDKNRSLPAGTLGQILGPKQTRLGHTGLKRLVQKHRKP